MAEEKPNVVVFCTDHQRSDYLGCMGHPLIKTPNLDRLAGKGALFENLYVQSTVCMPSRASIVTGQYPCRHTVTDNGYDLPEHCATVAHILRDNGYHTMAVGRTHLICTQPRPDYSKTDFYGFSQCAHAQVYCGDTDPGNDYLDWIKNEHPEYYKDIAFANRHPGKDLMGSRTKVPQELSLNSWVVDKSLHFIKQHNENSPEKPFMLWAGTWDPHSPYRAPEPWGSMYKPEDIPLPAQTEEELEKYPATLRELVTTEWRHNPDCPMETIWRNTTAMYMGMISHIDDQFGRLLDGLEEMGVADNTVIYFTSDHGDMMGEHWFVGKRLFFYDGALKVPGIMAGPGIPQNTKVKRLAETVDMTPTILDLCGIKPDPEIQGKSWKSVFDDESEILHDDVYTEFQYHHNRTGTPEDFENNQHTFSIFDGRYRIVCFKKRKYGQLFDMEKDPGCHVNFWDDPEYTEIKQDMKEKLLNRLMNNLSRPDTRKADW